MTSERRRVEFLRTVEEALSPLSWEPERQVAYVRGLGVDVDEMALHFDDIFHLARAKMQGGVLSPEAFQALVPVDEMLARMTEKGPDLWSEEPLPRQNGKSSALSRTGRSRTSDRPRSSR
jgi:hypothetical protein